MKSTFIPSLLSILLTTTANAYVNGPCSNGGSADGICISRGSCANYGGTSNPGSPGAYTCPGTPDDVECCSVFTRCPGLGTDTLCTWDNRCSGNPWHGSILSNPICPGGNNFVCCDING
ncbi:hypothetical protein BKA61DRAFT_715893 [Leptodontidium sp. MPI-SDFR-AT-0119]|nr:hypothetical protein BKA61DRAFT_715893 [Leptodontidium sp. MPI-SDFR-AT-0119]